MAEIDVTGFVCLFFCNNLGQFAPSEPASDCTVQGRLLFFFRFVLFFNWKAEILLT